LTGVQKLDDEKDLAAFFISVEEIYVPFDKPKDIWPSEGGHRRNGTHKLALLG
jgi:hypothetical protein